jgi:NDP-sugar pyrophosphorylase family protein
MEKEIFPNISDQSRVRVVFLEFPFLDIGTPDRYAAAEKFLCRTCTEGK